MNNGIKNLFDGKNCVSVGKQLVVLPDFRTVTKFQGLLYPDFLNSSIKIYNYYNYSYVYSVRGCSATINIVNKTAVATYSFDRPMLPRHPQRCLFYIKRKRLSSPYSKP